MRWPDRLDFRETLGVPREQGHRGARGPATGRVTPHVCARSCSDTRARGLRHAGVFAPGGRARVCLQTDSQIAALDLQVQAPFRRRGGPGPSRRRSLCSRLHERFCLLSTQQGLLPRSIRAQGSLVPLDLRGG